MILTVLFAILAVIGLYLNYKKEHIESKGVQKKYAMIILIIGIVGLTANNLMQYNSNLKLEQLTRKRTLSENQKEIIYQSIVCYKGSRIEINRPADSDEENFRYAKCFAEVFQSAGWEVEQGQILGGQFSKHGLAEVNIFIKNAYDSTIMYKLIAIENGFKEAKIGYKFVVDPSQNQDEIKLYISRGY